MSRKKIWSLFLMILGICCFIFGTIISSKVKDGELEIQSAQRGVNAVKGAASVNPYTKEIGKIATRSAQKKIDDGKVKVKEYKTLAFWFRLGGIIVFVIGAILLIL